jgi:hypothetical protein
MLVKSSQSFINFTKGPFRMNSTVDELAEFQESGESLNHLQRNVPSDGWKANLDMNNLS